MRATAKAAPARCPAYAPHLASCCRVVRSRMAMKCHGCVFFELCARLPAFKIERMASSDKGWSVKWRTARLVRMSSETVINVYLLCGLQTKVRAEEYSATNDRPSHCITGPLPWMGTPGLEAAS